MILGLLDEPGMSVMSNIFAGKERMVYYSRIKGEFLLHNSDSAAYRRGVKWHQWHFKLRNKPESSECRLMKKGTRDGAELRVEAAMLGEGDALGVRS